MFSLYSKFSRIKIDESICFGKYPQGVDGRKIDIEWRVLDVKDNKALLISNQCLITAPYCQFEVGKENWSSLYWMHCYARKELNNNFYTSAFSRKERHRILPNSTM